MKKTLGQGQGDKKDIEEDMDVDGITDTETETTSREKEIQEQNRILNKKCVCIVVLGDIGRSPRMRYHANSLAEEGFFVQMIGYGGSGLPEDMTNNPAIWHYFMREPPAFIQELPRLISYAVKVVWQWLFLSWAFLWMTFGHRFNPDFILLQNPPAIPTLALCWIYSKIYRCPLIVDWHNYGFSLMAMKNSAKSPLLRFAKWFEDYFGAKATHHLCVTRAMKDDLKKRLNVSAITLYDRPPDHFHSITKEERQEFLKKLSQHYPRVKDAIAEKAAGILVSSTSWTEDEDFSILLEAIKDYEAARSESEETYPRLILFITGKGPQQEFYRNIINSMKLEHVDIYLPWLEYEDYPKLLASADLGVSLHTSSSGLDLPMKVVDMFGSGLPVCAMNFSCISELVQHNENSLVFRDSQELGQQIQDWFKIREKPYPNHTKFPQALKSFQSIRWHENWVFNVGPIFQQQ